LKNGYGSPAVLSQQRKQEKSNGTIFSSVSSSNAISADCSNPYHTVSIRASYNVNITAAINPAPAPTALTDFIQLAALAVACAAAVDDLVEEVAVPLAVPVEVPFALAACVQISALTVTATMIPIVLAL
jgi:hypothetical protein